MTDRKTRALQLLAEDIRELCVEVRTTANEMRQSGAGEDGIRRRNAEPLTYRVAHHGLLAQLVAALPPSGRTEGGRGGKPASRAPSDPATSNALDDIVGGWQTPQGDWQIGVRGLRARLCLAAGKPPAKRVPVVSALHEIRALAHGLDAEHAEETAAAVRAYVTRAKAALAYEAPVARLRDVRCLHCGGVLKVAQDVSSDVWCPNRDCRDEQGRPHTWPRETWPRLLAESQGAA